MKALIVGGNSGVGLALVLNLIKRGFDHVYVVGKDQPKESDLGENLAVFNQKTTFFKTNLINGDFALFDKFYDINALFFPRID